MAYQLWETAAGNLIGFYATRERALAVVAQSIGVYGKEYVATWLLECQDANGDGAVMAEGDELVELAMHAMAPQTPARTV